MGTLGAKGREKLWHRLFGRREIDSSGLSAPRTGVFMESFPLRDRFAGAVGLLTNDLAELRIEESVGDDSFDRTDDVCFGIGCAGNIERTSPNTSKSGRNGE